MEKILFLAYHFPPAQNGAVARFYSYYKHLPKFGYQPVILTINNFGKIEDEENVYRYNSLSDIPRKPYYKRFINKRIQKIYNIFDPSFDFKWRKAVKQNIETIIEEHNIKAVYSSFPPSESFHLGMYISKKYNLPLISEFRDGYAYESVLAKQTYSVKKFLRYYEKKIVENSKLIITVSNRLTDYFRNFYHFKETFTVFNGYEDSDFQDLPEKKNIDSNKTKIVNFGSMDISGKRDVSFLYHALSSLKNDNVINEKFFELSLIGKYSKKEKDYINNLQLNDVVKLYEPMAKLDGFRLICSEYDYLLLYGLPGISHNIPSKTFEYLKLGKPIIGICKGNESEQIINQTGCGEVCDFETGEIYQLLKKAVESKINYKPVTEKIITYNRIIQAEKLSEIFKDYCI